MTVAVSLSGTVETFACMMACLCACLNLNASVLVCVCVILTLA